MLANYYDNQGHLLADVVKSSFHIHVYSKVSWYHFLS